MQYTQYLCTVTTGLHSSAETGSDTIVSPFAGSIVLQKRARIRSCLPLQGPFPSCNQVRPFGRGEAYVFHTRVPLSVLSLVCTEQDCGLVWGVWGLPLCICWSDRVATEVPVWVVREGEWKGAMVRTFSNGLCTFLHTGCVKACQKGFLVHSGVRTAVLLVRFSKVCICSAVWLLWALGVSELGPFATPLGKGGCLRFMLHH
jgi:hypothetical protein